MPSLAAHLISKYYNDYKSRDIAFNKSVIKVTGLEPKKVFLKIQGEQWSCMLYSCSMKFAKLLLVIDQKGFELLKKAKNYVNLRLSFLPSDIKNSIVFFVPGLITGYKNFMEQNKNTFLMTLEFSQRPPDDLIEIIGKIISEKDSFEKRKDFRISLEGRVVLDIGLSSNKTITIIENIKRPCIVKNISASGSLIILACNPKFIMNKKVSLYLLCQNNNIILEGKVVRHENLEGRKDIYSVGIQFDIDKIPHDYKQMINNYLDKLEGMVKQK